MIIILAYISLLLVALFLIFFSFCIAFILVTGAPYVPTSSSRQEAMFRLVRFKKGWKTADLGSGDGRLVIEMAKRGAEAHGFEINPFLVWLSRRNIKKAKLEKKAFIHQKNFWKENYQDYDLIIIYELPHVVRFLEKKLTKELKKGSYLLLNYFKFPHLKPLKQDNGVYLYQKT